MNTQNNTIGKDIKTEDSKKTIESTVLKLLRTQEYTLNAVNNYGENLLHVSAAYGCSDIIKEILQKKEHRQVINRKNKFGWTPLMQAIRNRNIDTVKLLLQQKSNINDSTYLGMSVVGIACAISKEMLQIIYEICPSALINAMNDDISPLCIAALKNDKDLFFSLIDMGLDVSKANEYTHIMMKQSTVPEIANLARCYDEIEDYWNDESNDIPIKNESSNNGSITEYKNKSQYIVQMQKDFNNKDDILNNNNNNNDDNNNKNNNNNNISLINIGIYHTDTNNQSNLMETLKSNYKEKHSECLNINLLSAATSAAKPSLISPTFLDTSNVEFPTSPNIYFVKNCTNLATINENDEKDPFMTETEEEYNKLLEFSTSTKDSKHSPTVMLKRLQSIRPADLDLTSVQNDHNTTLEFIPEFSPTQSPNVPAYINDENASGDKTPTPPHYRTPPRGMVLNSQQTKMIVFLKRYGLCHHMSTFLKEEIDMDLILMLSDNDLQEIGIKEEAERISILTAIKTYQNIEM
ncbi:ankyrin repeat and ELMO domain-containing protein D-like [Vespula squamosa]|uniref:Ankyrin repeat and ELMO domain-containing protein D-like n=1 Tax=Vespula squamosa TaxID=30214 RepID=A0ABD2BYC0_VESSQ